MTRQNRPSLSTSGIEQNLPLRDSESDSLTLQHERRRPNGRATPETKAKDVFKLERSRQRTAIKHMQATHGEMALTTKVLLELLSDTAFVALLRAQGFTSIPKLLHQRLMERR